MRGGSLLSSSIITLVLEKSDQLIKLRTQRPTSLPSLNGEGGSTTSMCFCFDLPSRSRNEQFQTFHLAFTVMAYTMYEGTHVVYLESGRNDQWMGPWIQ